MFEIVDAVVIGGGIIGMSTLYHLTKKGMRNPVLLEMDNLGGGSTRYTAGWVMLQLGTELEMQWSKISYAEFMFLREEYKINFEQKGSLIINTHDFIESEKALFSLQTSLGIPTELLSPEQVRKLAPFIKLREIGSGRYCGLDGVIDAQAAIQQYKMLAELSGAKVYEQSRVLGITVSSDKITSVKTSDKTFYTPIVVNAAGFYADQVARLVGLELPIKLDLRHSVFTEPIESIYDEMPLLQVVNPIELYIGSHGKRADYTIGSFAIESYEQKPQLDWIVDRYYEYLVDCVPEIARARITRVEAGIRVFSVDGKPIIGPVEGIEGYFNNCAWGGTGVMHAPFAGQAIVDAILGEQKFTQDIEPLLFDRFKPNFVFKGNYP